MFKQHRILPKVTFNRVEMSLKLIPRQWVTFVKPAQSRNSRGSVLDLWLFLNPSDHFIIQTFMDSIQTTNEYLPVLVIYKFKLKFEVFIQFYNTVESF